MLGDLFANINVTFTLIMLLLVSLHPTIQFVVDQKQERVCNHGSDDMQTMHGIIVQLCCAVRCNSPVNDSFIV